MAENLSYLGVTPILKNLHFCGYYQLDPNSSKMRKILHTAYMRLILFLTLLFVIQQIIQVYQDRDDLSKVIDTIFLTLTSTDAIYKQIVLWKKANRIEALLNIMKGPIFNQKRQGHQEFLLKAGRQARLLLRAFNIAGQFSCLLYAVYPVMLYVQRKPVDFGIWVPFDANLSPQFYFVSLYVFVEVSWLAFSNITMDVFITFFLVQCKTQLSILRFDLEHVVEQSKEEAARSSEDFQNILEQRLKIILLHHNEIIKFSAMFQEVFGGAVFYLFLVGGWIICTTAYRTVGKDPMSLEFMTMVSYMGCILTELYIYCHYGNEVTHEQFNTHFSSNRTSSIKYLISSGGILPPCLILPPVLCLFWILGMRHFKGDYLPTYLHIENIRVKSEKLITSAYALDWLEIPVKHRRALIIFMERFKRTMILMAGHLIPLSNGTFVSVMRSSYTFYAFLKNTN